MGTLQKLLAVSVLGSMFYGIAVGLAAQFLAMENVVGAWVGRVPLLTLPLALPSAFLLALMVCAQFLFLYPALRTDASLRLITAQALRVQARTSVLLLGVVPVYAAVVLLQWLV